MILHGIDLIEISRIKLVIIRWGDRFLHRFFTPQELEYCNRFKNPYQHFAVRFAAKEAGVKALSELFECYISQFEVVSNHSSSPHLKYLQSDNYIGKLSLSHTDTLAIASVIFENDNRSDKITS